MSRSSSDVLYEIEVQAALAKEEAKRGRFSWASKRLPRMRRLLSEAERRLNYEAECKREATGR